jgi:hypothetical protein
MRQIQKLYRKEKSKLKEEKKYIVTKNVHQASKGKTARNVKVVDKRMRKDLKINKAKVKKAKKQGKAKNRNA